MSLRHIVLFRFHDGTPTEQVVTLSAALDALPGKIGQIRSYEHGPSAGVRPGAWDYALVAEFASVEDFTAYLEHPDHVAVVRSVVDPISAQRVSVQVEV